MSEKELSRRFAQSYRKTVDLGGNKNCSLKRHFYGVLREVVGYLDVMAAKHPETRFVYPHVQTIVEHCKKFDSKNQYGKNSIEKALKYLQRRHIISGRCPRQCDGQIRDGFIVAPHEHLTVQPAATKCVFVGMAAPFDCWEQLPTGEVFWVNPARVYPGSVRDNPGAINCCTERCTDESTGHCMGESMDRCTERCTDTPSVQQYGCESLQIYDKTTDTS